MHGRFTSIDPLAASATPDNPQTWNRYTYVRHRNIARTVKYTRTAAGRFEGLWR
jgi:transposase